MTKAAKKITVTVRHDEAERLAELVRRCNELDKADPAHNTHGQLTVAGLLAMLAEDAAMVISRPGCWEASNMHQVLASHGYEV
jgi:hypothetical protein